MDLFSRSNDALLTNPPPLADQILSEGVDNWLWVVTALFIVAFVCSIDELCRVYIANFLLHS